MTPLLLAHWAVGTFISLRAQRDQLDEVGQVQTQRDFRSGARVSGATAIIPIYGVIDYRASMMSDFGMMVSSETVRQDFNRLAGDPAIEKIVFDVDSPGGVYSGLPELGRDIFASRGQVQTIAVANPMAASGALWLSAAAEKFFVLGSGQVGSLGALMLHSDHSKFYESNGITNTILRSPEGKADFNPLEPLSEESRVFHQQQIEAIADEFLTGMAKMRGVSKKLASANFGQGRMLDGQAAVAAGLVDGIVGSIESVLGSKVKPMKRIKLNPMLQLAKVRGELQRQRAAEKA